MNVLDFCTTWYYTTVMKIGRPKEFEEETVLERAMEYFWDKGYDNASLAGLLKAMGIKKSSFYQTFESKQKIFERCMQRYIELGSKEISDKLTTQSAKDILRAYLNRSILEIQKFGEVRGCLVMNAGAECYKKYPDISSLVKEHFVFFHNSFTDLVKQAQKEGDISKEKSASMLASSFMTILNGLAIMIKAGADENIISDIQEHFEELFKA